MNSVGLLYLSPHLYNLGMRGLYGKYYNPSYKKVADLIPDNSSVVDVCCGSGKLYEFLKNKNVAYVGLDGSKPFIKYLRDKGIDARLTDVNGDPIPTADYIILQRSLYQFKNPDILIRKLIGSAKKSLIISESVQNLGQSSSLLVNKILHKIVPYFVGTNFNDTSFRFTEQEFTHLLKRYHPKFKKISGGKDLVAVINKIET